jgi:Arc/MetJ-type ribon-helix-helix transcriptional regulator
MTLSVRIDEETKARLRRRLLQKGGSLSDFVRAAILEKLEREGKKRTPYELGKHLFGRFDSGRDDLATNSEKILREKLRAKHRR